MNENLKEQPSIVDYSLGVCCSSLAIAAVSKIGIVQGAFKLSDEFCMTVASVGVAETAIGCTIVSVIAQLPHINTRPPGENKKALKAGTLVGILTTGAISGFVYNDLTEEPQSSHSPTNELKIETPAPQTPAVFRIA